MVSLPPAGTRFCQVAAGDLPRRRLEALQPPQHGHADHHADGAHQQQRDGRRPCHHPAQVVRHLLAQFRRAVIQNQDAVDLVARVVAAVAFRPVADGYHGAQDLAVARFDHPAGSRLVGRHLQLALRARPVQEHQPLHPALLAEAFHHFGDQGPVVLDHLVFQRHADQIALGQSGGPRRPEQRSHVVFGI